MAYKRSLANQRASKAARSPLLRPLLALIFVLAIALALLLYIASVDAFQSYSGFLLDSVNSSAELIERTIESLLQGGLTLPQLVGFDIITTPIILSDDAVYDITIIDTAGEILFRNSKAGYTPSPLSSYETLEFASASIDSAVYRNADSFQIRTPLDGRFDQSGTLLVTMPDSIVSQSIGRYFFPVAVSMLLAILIYASILFSLLKKRRTTTVGVNLVYSISFTVVAVFLIISLIQIYSDGAQQKAQAVSALLSERLGVIFDTGLVIDDIDGIAEEFTDYKRLNPDIEFVSLIQDGIVIVHTDPEQQSTPYQQAPGSIEYYKEIRADSGVAISIAIPRRVILTRLLRNIKNFAVLFFASAFLSWLLLRMLFSIYPDIDSALKTAALSSESAQTRALLDLIFPAFFLANFVEGLHYSYLPQFLNQLAVNSGFADGQVGTVYALYWAMYALVLIPSGRSARTLTGIRHLLITGFLIITLSMVLMAYPRHFAWVYLIRSIAGLGQGMVFIAVQSYILQQSSNEQRTEGVSIIVYGYNGGVISGTIIGALLVPSLGASWLFAVSALIAVFMVWYSIRIVGRTRVKASVPEEERESSYPANFEMRQSLYTYGTGGGVSVRDGFLHRLKLLFTDVEFTKTILLVGIIAKAVLAGIAFLVLPHFLDKLDYRQESIGQILMFYAVGVLLVSRLVARYTDRIGNTRRILFLGSIGSAIGLGVIASAEVIAGPDAIALRTVVLILGVLLLGLSHGFVHAPIVTHITRVPVSAMLGRTVAASIYRFMERSGHVLGPLLFGYFFLREGTQISSIYYVAIMVGVCSLLFYFIPSPKSKEEQGSV